MKTLTISFHLRFSFDGKLKFSFSFPLYSKFCKELEKCEDAPEKLASCFLSSVSTQSV